jgi:phosphate transport system substrate-binding protein
VPKRSERVAVSLFYWSLRRLLELVVLRFRSEREKEIEILLLRHHGIAAITARTVDFGASDAPLSKDEFAACKGCVQIPWALSATSIPYNLDLNKRLRLNGKVLAGIYLGQIKNWSDKRIKKLNPGVSLPNLKITPVYRSDNSGTSYNFTDYLSHVNATWKSRIGTETNAKWPAGIGAPKSNGVAAAVSQT